MSKRPAFRSIIMAVCLIGIMVFLPNIFNIAIKNLNKIINTQISLCFDWDKWIDVLSLALPSALTFVVIKQSEQQQKENMEMQKRLERINKNLLDLEKKTKIGYFIPLVEEKNKDSSRGTPHIHDLKKYITLVNSGTDDVFITKATGTINGRHYNVPCEKGLFVPCNSALSKLDFDCSLCDKELLLPHLDIEIKLTLENMFGYRYIQTMDIGFKNHNGKGTVDSFNMKIQEEEHHAD